MSHLLECMQQKHSCSLRMRNSEVLDQCWEENLRRADREIAWLISRWNLRGK